MVFTHPSVERYYVSEVLQNRFLNNDMNTGHVFFVS